MTRRLLAFLPLAGLYGAQFLYYLFTTPPLVVVIFILRLLYLIGQGAEEAFYWLAEWNDLIIRFLEEHIESLKTWALAQKGPK